ncbi:MULTISPECIES: beta-ketoacyl-ACP synthase II [unclassified Aureimonas]|uniref:beta-ketoacyl-ACP synthase II n=1 Tax=unclassified Aureimonas TaxID=2615206 RepID=UPI0006FDB5FC|nr:MULTISPECIES: beta-ketoacyl-ACP synthase II [unclassified Aureimonas]KQT52113.1 3-oxoacyl-ACP synthase [Aureimonas sp. Leaf427]KQT70654.1 3-oxoacyl-ACP synthase [Aureimonas sp. Leaf460]
MASESPARIVVTGMGVVSPLGVGAEPAWSRLVANRSGIRRLPDEAVPDVASKIAGVVPGLDEDPFGFDVETIVPSRDRRKMDRFIHFSLEAARQAITQARWAPDEAGKDRTATIVASGIGGFHSMLEAVDIVQTRGVRRLSPFTVSSFLVNLAAGQISIQYGFRGPLGAPVTACAASVQAIGDGMRLIRSGEADVVVCGGAESCIARVTLGSFGAARALSTGFNDRPEEASRPFDRARDGFVMGEGAGMIVIESLAHALARGAVPLGELSGYGTTADAHHPTAARSDGDGAQRAMRLALAMARVAPEEIDYINAHATSTPIGDASELAAIRSVFGKGRGPAISSTKSASGHLLGAAGVFEVIVTLLALRDGLLPPNLNLRDPDEMAEGLDLVGPTTRRSEGRIALSNAFGFGGVNASIVLKRWTGD